jgi:hypothetical protein
MLAETGRYRKGRAARESSSRGANSIRFAVAAAIATRIFVSAIRCGH